MIHTRLHKHKVRHGGRACLTLPPRESLSRWVSLESRYATCLREEGTGHEGIRHENAVNSMSLRGIVAGRREGASITPRCCGSERSDDITKRREGAVDVACLAQPRTRCIRVALALRASEIDEIELRRAHTLDAIRASANMGRQSWKMRGMKRSKCNRTSEDDGEQSLKRGGAGEVGLNALGSELVGF